MYIQFLILLLVNLSLVFSQNDFCLQQFRSSALQNHNQFRAKHGSASLVLDSNLNNMAQTHAKNLADKADLQVSGTLGVGENLFYYWFSDPKGMPDCNKVGQLASESWYKEANKYNFQNPGFSQGTGDFTQLVWKSSRQVGFGIAFSSDGKKVVVVANYSPQGNVLSAFKENVFPANQKSSGMNNNPAGLNNDGGFTNQAGQNNQADMNNNGGFNNQANMNNNGGFNNQANMNNNGGFNNQVGMNNNGGFNNQVGQNKQAGLNNNGGFNNQVGQNKQAGLNNNGGFNNQANMNNNGGFNNQANMNNNGGFNNQVDQNKQAGLNNNGGFNNQVGQNKQAGLKNKGGSSSISASILGGNV